MATCYTYCMYREIPYMNLKVQCALISYYKCQSDPETHTLRDRRPSTAACPAFRAMGTKGVGPSTTLAWPGWKQPDIAVEVETARLYTSRFKKCCVNCELLYYPSTEFKSAVNVY
jgi:hypothetical protein